MPSNESIADLTLFPKRLVDMLNDGYIEGIEKKIPVAGASTRNNLYTIARWFEEHRPRTSLEIGLATGASALVCAHAHHLRGDPHQGIHYAIDPFQSDLADAGLLQITEAGLDNSFAHIRESSEIALPRFLSEGKKFDFIYIDGSHLFEHVFLDTFYCLRLLNDGGAVFFDDSTIRDVSKVLRFIRRNLSDMVRELDLTPYRPTEAVDWKYNAAKAFRYVQLIAFSRLSDPERHWNSKLTNF